MKYDIEFVIPVSLNGKYLQRVRDFKKIGLLNIGKNKVLVNFLVGRENVPFDLFNDTQYDFRIIKSEFDLHSSKIADFYLKNDPNDIQSRWIAKIDDDSVNDVSGLVENLDTDFDCEQNYNIITDYRLEFDSSEYQVLKEMKFDNWLRSPKRHIAHEWECNILSKCALKTILSNKKSKEYLIRRANANTGPGDRDISIAARISKIYPVDAWFLTQHPDIVNFSLFEGVYNHIHYIAKDIDASKTDFLLEIINSNKKPLENKDFAFYVDNKPLGILRFSSNGKITNYNHENESFWLLRQNDLIIYDVHGKTSTEYKDFLNNQFNCFGYFHKNPSEQHLLKMIK
jgi:hypothetical protein